MHHSKPYTMLKCRGSLNLMGFFLALKIFFGSQELLDFTLHVLFAFLLFVSRPLSHANAEQLASASRRSKDK